MVSIGTEGRKHAVTASRPTRLARPANAIADIAIIEALHDNSVKLVFAEGVDDGVAQLTLPGLGQVPITAVRKVG